MPSVDLGINAEPVGVLQIRNVVMFNTAITLSQGWTLALLVTHSMRHWALTRSPVEV